MQRALWVHIQTIQSVLLLHAYPLHSGSCAVITVTLPPVAMKIKPYLYRGVVTTNLIVVQLVTSLPQQHLISITCTNNPRMLACSEKKSWLHAGLCWETLEMHCIQSVFASIICVYDVLISLLHSQSHCVLLLLLLTPSRLHWVSCSTGLPMHGCWLYTGARLV